MGSLREHPFNHWWSGTEVLRIFFCATRIYDEGFSSVLRLNNGRFKAFYQINQINLRRLILYYGFNGNSSFTLFQRN